MGTLLADHPVKAGAPGPVSLGSSKSTSMKYEVVVPSSCASAFIVEHFDPEPVESWREAPTLGRRMSGTADSESKEPESDDERSDDGGPSDIERVCLSVCLSVIYSCIHVPEKNPTPPPLISTAP